MWPRLRPASGFGFIAVGGCNWLRLHFDTNRIPIGDRHQEARRYVADTPPEGKTFDVKHAFLLRGRRRRGDGCGQNDGGEGTDVGKVIDAYVEGVPNRRAGRPGRARGPVDRR